ncbi:MULTISPECIES: xanthine dehydrogenase family protein subunit M [Clostridium]|uniref:Nicotinate dehydrogenase FAD-subunit n=1 Tax=Clostridium ragsdalei P11 TaxID=1353534 RepID=A0A1A6AK36_9CLOT|nr:MULTISPECIES: FAD binding domain-containing protein [Clostridium]OBR90414.1 nicotinate dehydrogenase FAD-subunit [Clostridium ragsdalei P11]QXE18216.1 molybdopterin dehydrogenase [Clostridium sp. 001]
MESFKPVNIKDTLDILNKVDAIVVAGGTDAMIKKRMEPGLLPDFKSNVVFINEVKELKNIERDEDYIYIGAACTYSEVCESELIPDSFRTVIDGIATPAIRNVGTLGGNICNASPAADMLPLLYAMEAQLIIESKTQKITVPIDEFIVGPGKTSLKKDEILTCIKIPANDHKLFYYKKVGTRKAAAISKLSFAAFVSISAGKVDDVCIAFGSVGSTVVRVKKGEEEIKKLNLDKALEIYGSSITPIDDQRSTAVYRKKVSINLLKDFMKKVEEKCNE